MGRTQVILQLSSDEQDSEAAGEIEKIIITAKKDVFSTVDGVLLGQVCSTQIWN